MNSIDLHLWESGGADSPSALTAWINDHLCAHQAAVSALLEPIAPRTPANTLIHYDRAIFELGLAASQAQVLNSVAASMAVRDQAQLEAARVAEAASALSLNQPVYQALAAIDLTSATPATRHYVEKTLLAYRLAGVDRDHETRAKIQALQTQATRLSLEFARNIQEGAKNVEATAAELEGLPDDYISRHPANAEGKIILSTDPPEMQPVMTFAQNADLRRRMFVAYNTRASPQNSILLRQLLETRQQVAHTLGFRSWADLATADQMMGSAANARTFIAKLDEASRAGAEREHERILAFAHSRGHQGEIDSSSRAYWYELYRRDTYAFDSQSVRPYFPYKSVEAGVLSTSAQLFGLEFRPVSAPSWHSAVSVFEVYEQGTLRGRFHLDMHPREGKDKWFSAAPLVYGFSGGPTPEAALICNFPETTTDDPGLLQFSDVVTYLHEFGHLMHALLGGHTEWAGLSGFATEGDFIEVPSQMLEEFFRDSALLQSFAHHHLTGEPIPLELVERMKQASAFGRADWMRSQIYYTTLSLDLHDLDIASIDFDQLTRELFERYQPWTWIEENRMYASFGHLTGYSSNYYTYAFDKVIALDFFAQFDPANLLTGPAAARYKQTILTQGGSKPGRQMVRDFLGREESFAPFAAWLTEEFAV